jgi:leucine efflux protein
MTHVDWIGFLVASVAVVLAPGPGSMFVARTAASAGVRTGRSAMLGIMVGDACLIVLSLLGISALFTAYPSLFHIIRLAGAGYLILLGIQSFLVKPKRHSPHSQNGVLSFRRAVGITLLNPKAVFFFMAFFPVFIKSTGTGMLIPYATMMAVFMAISASYLYCLSYISSRIGSAFQENYTLKSVFRKLCGSIFIGFGVKVAISSR